MEAWLRNQRRSPAGTPPPAAMTLRRRAISSSNNSDSVATERRRSHSSHSNNSCREEGGFDVEDRPALSTIIVERKEADEGEEEEVGGQQQQREPPGQGVERSGSGIARQPAGWLQCSVCGFVGATLAWYCWGLAFLAPLGPSKNAIQPEVARWSHRLNPVSFYAMQCGRLVGAPLFGHLGDRQGRRPAFAASLALIGLATVAMGCFWPLRINGEGHGTGVRTAWAALRFLLGMGVAGQCAGNMLVPMEDCRSEKTSALAAAIGHAGMPVGLALAAAAAYACLLDEQSAMRFPEGLRLAQLAGALLLLPVALWAFTGKEEGPLYTEMEEAGEKERWPLLVLLRYRGCGLLGGALAIALDCFVKASTVYYWPILLPHGIGHGGINVYACLAISLLAMAGCTFLGSAVRERLVSRCNLFRIGAAIATGGMWVWFYLVRSHKPAHLLAADLLVLGVGLGLMHGAQDALLVEPFPTPIAYTGIGVLYQATNALVHMVYPSLAYWLIALGESSERKLVVAPGVNATGIIVSTFILGAVGVCTVQYLKAYQRPSSLHRDRSLRVRECVQISGSPPSSETPAIVVNPDPSLASSESPAFRLSPREIAGPP